MALSDNTRPDSELADRLSPDSTLIDRLSPDKGYSDEFELHSTEYTKWVFFFKKKLLQETCGVRAALLYLSIVSGVATKGRKD